MRYLPIAFVMVCFGCTSNQPQTHQSHSAHKATTVSNFEPARNITDTFSIDYVIGKFDPATHPDFTLIDKSVASDGKMRMRKDAYNAFLEMRKAAKEDGIDLKIISAVRPFHHQKRIWEAKWNGARKVDGQDLSKTMPNAVDRAYKILTYSSMPGTSRHHWGTDIDLNSLEPAFFEKGEGAKTFEWLSKNAKTYGYCQPYSQKGEIRPHGYNEEKWHWSYNPVSLELTNLAKRYLTNEMISGFEGADAAPKIDVVGKYILGINQECK